MHFVDMNKPSSKDVGLYEAAVGVLLSRGIFSDAQSEALHLTQAGSVM